MGDSVNLAARLMAKAPAGRVYATGDVLRGAKTSFAQSRPRAVHGQGQDPSGPRVGCRAGRCAAPPKERSGSSCRWSAGDSELDHLRVAVARARRGSGTLIELVGETGSGKSRLLAEAARIGQGMAELRAGCEVYTRDTPVLGLAWAAAAAARRRTRTRPSRSWLDRLRSRSRPNSRADPVALAARDRPRRRGCRRRPRSSSSPRRRAPPSSTRSCCAFLGRALVVPTIVEVEQAHLMDAASAALFRRSRSSSRPPPGSSLITRRDVDRAA